VVLPMPLRIKIGRISLLKRLVLDVQAERALQERLPHVHEEMSDRR